MPRLTIDDVDYIRERREDGVSIADLAESYGVGKKVIRAICTGRELERLPPEIAAAVLELESFRM